MTPPPRRPLPEVLPGEDRTFNPAPDGAPLFVDLVPASCWFTNVRSHLAPADWDRVRRMVYERAGHRCEACGEPARPQQRIWLEAHERWAYDEAPTDEPFASFGMPVQRLRRLVCLCTRCHETTHLGLAGLRGHHERAFDHLCAVNGWTRSRARIHVTEANRLFEERSRVEWLLDLNILLLAGVQVLPPR
ncbi:HNH endonuclease [Nocardioides jiangxiensis]|uniref:HNH endonuclease n=1 Tax=Nocardioides jiangxiensis TaxID=3064524 RepID=A0ABT9B099_9ACTN|nr:HNH endonuclease [Nocardioides sp. WY-20]MDO7867047.1 HNH endonuclease [Nocardioides sp. WY-20]